MNWSYSMYVRLDITTWHCSFSKYHKHWHVAAKLTAAPNVQQSALRNRSQNTWFTLVWVTFLINCNVCYNAEHRRTSYWLVMVNFPQIYKLLANANSIKRACGCAVWWYQSSSEYAFQKMTVSLPFVASKSSCRVQLVKHYAFGKVMSWG